MGTLSKTVKIKYDVDQKSAKRGLDALAKSTEKVRKGATDSAAAVGSLGRASRRGSTGLAGFAKQADRVGNGLRNTGDAIRAVNDGFQTLANNANQSAVAVSNLPFSIAAARGATRGMVDDLKLQQLAFTANQFGVAQTSEEFARLTDAATKLGLAQGVGATKSAEDLTRGIARQSSAILDNLGIIVKADKAYEDYARTNGKVVGALSSAEKQQAFTTAALNAAEEAAGKVNVKLDQSAEFIATWEASLKNASVTVSDVFVHSLTGLSLALEGVLLEASGVNDEISRLNQQNGGVTGQRGLGGRGGQAEQQAQALETLRETQRQRQRDSNADDIDTKQRALQLLDVEVTKISGVNGQQERQNTLREAGALLELEILELKTRNAELDGRGADSFQRRIDLEKRRAELENRRDLARQGNGRGSGNLNRSGRLQFQQQLTEAINAERLREFSQATSLQRNFLRNTQVFEAQLAETRLASFSRSQESAAENARLAGLEENAATRRTELELARAESEAQRYLIEESVFTRREEALQRRIELETQVGEKQALQDQLEQVRHERVLARISEEQRARDAAAVRQQNTIRIVDSAQQGSFQLAQTLAGAAIQGDERRLKAQNALKAAGLYVDAALVGAQAVISFASGNYVQGAAQAAASVNAAAVATVIASGGARGNTGGVSATAGTATQFGGGASNAPRAQFSVDRGAPISVRDDIEGNPNNTTGRNAQSNSGTVININGLSVLGTVDDQSSLTIAKSIKRAEANLGA